MLLFFNVWLSRVATATPAAEVLRISDQDVMRFSIELTAPANNDLRKKFIFSPRDSSSMQVIPRGLRCTHKVIGRV